MDETPLKVLVIDDSPFVLARTATVLRQHGFEVESASSPIGCSGRILRMKPDVVLLDVEMPALGGPEFLTQLRAHASIARARVVFYSDLPAAELSTLAEETGADGYICKGVAAEELVQRVHRFARTGRGNTPSVLLVDHERWTALELALQQRAKHSFASSGRAALERILGLEPPDLVVCSMELPDMTGLDVHAMVRGVDIGWTARFLLLVDRTRTHPSLRQFLDVGGRATDRTSAALELAKLMATVGERRSVRPSSGPRVAERGR